MNIKYTRRFSHRLTRRTNLLQVHYPERRLEGRYDRRVVCAAVSRRSLQRRGVHSVRRINVDKFVNWLTVVVAGIRAIYMCYFLYKSTTA
jgi:hypothetical protein